MWEFLTWDEKNNYQLWCEPKKLKNIYGVSFTLLAGKLGFVYQFIELVLLCSLRLRDDSLPRTERNLNPPQLGSFLDLS